MPSIRQSRWCPGWWYPRIYPEQLAYSAPSREMLSLDPRYRIRSPCVAGLCASQSVAPRSRLARNGVSKRMRPVTRSSASSSLVSRAKSGVPSPALRSVVATNRLRGLCRLLPLRARKAQSQVHARAYRACLRASLRRLKTNLLVVFLHRHRESLPCLQNCSQSRRKRLS